MKMFDKINIIAKEKPITFEVIRFLIAGAISTLLDFLVMAIVLYVLSPATYNFDFLLVIINGKRIASTFDVVISSATGFIVSLIFNYIVSIFFVFKETNFGKTKKGFFLFLLISIISFTIQTLGIWIFYDKAKLNEWLAKILVTLISLIITFSLRKALIFNKAKLKM